MSGHLDRNGFVCPIPVSRSLERFRSWGQRSREKLLFTPNCVEVHPKRLSLDVHLTCTNIKSLYTKIIEHTERSYFGCGSLTGCLLRETMDLENNLSKLTPYKTQQIYNTRPASPMAIR